MPDRPTINDFGLLIAYVLPGYTALWGTQALAGGYGGLPLGADATVGDFLFSTVAAVTAGLTVSTLRWLVVDSIHHRTGIRPPDWDFARLGDRTEAFALDISRSAGRLHGMMHYSKNGLVLAGAYAAICIGLIWSQGPFGESFIALILGMPWTLALASIEFGGASGVWLYVMIIAPMVLNAVLLYLLGSFAGKRR